MKFRFTEVHHLEPKKKKEILTILREDEVKRSILFGHINKQRTYRRAHDFSVRAIDAMRKGKLVENEKRKKENLQNSNNEKMKLATEMKNNLISISRQSDAKWIKNDATSLETEIDRITTVSHLMHFPEFRSTNQASSEFISILNLKESKKVNALLTIICI